MIPDDVKELAEPVLAHRIVVRGIGSQLTGSTVVQSVLNLVRVPTEQKA